MSTLKAHEKKVLERLFERREERGYVLDFNDSTFAAFFREHNIDIGDPKYKRNGTSKMNRLRGFWEIDADPIVGRVLEALLKYSCEIQKVSDEDKDKAIGIIERLKGKPPATADAGSTENEFLKREFEKVNLTLLNLDSQLQLIIEQRINEINSSLNDSPLAVVFLCGSTLEGLLLDVASKNPRLFNSAQAADKKGGKVKQFHEWTLDSLINVSFEVGLLSRDVKDHSHSLRNFRNYIHPRQQAIQNFTPDLHTAQISWQVLRAVIADLAKIRRKET